jgi:hypothetical protein
MSDAQTNWIDFNQRYLTAALAEVRSALERHAERNNDAKVKESSSQLTWDASFSHES